MTGMRAVLLSLVSAVCLLAQGTPVPVTPLQIIDSRGGKAIPCVNCALYTYSAGTTTPLATYTSATLSSVLPNPVRTNSAGYAVSGSSDITGVWIGFSCYKLILKDASAVTIWSQDQVCSQEELTLLLLAQSSGASRIGYTLGVTGAQTTTVQAELRQHYGLKADFGAAGDGVTDDTAALSAAIVAASTNGYALHIESGNYLVCGSAPSIPSGKNVLIYGDGMFVSTLKPYGGADACTTALTITTTGDVSLRDFGCQYGYVHVSGPIVPSSCIVVTGPGATNAQTPPNSVDIENMYFSQAKSVGLQCSPCQHVTYAHNVSYKNYFFAASFSGTGTVASPTYTHGFNIHDNLSIDESIGIGLNFFMSDISVTGNVFIQSNLSLVQTPHAYATIEGNVFDGVPDNGCYYDGTCGTISGSWYPMFMEGPGDVSVGQNYFSNINGSAGVFDASGSNLSIGGTDMALPTNNLHVNGLVIENSTAGFPLLVNTASTTFGGSPVTDGGNIKIENSKLTNVNQCIVMSAATSFRLANNSCEIAKNGGYTLSGDQNGTVLGNTGHNVSTAGGTTYTAGTVAGSSGSATITGTGTTFVSGMAGGSFTALGTVYQICTFTSTTSITLCTPLVTALSGSSYSIFYGATTSHPGILISGTATYNVYVAANSFKNDSGTSLSYGINDTTGLTAAQSRITYDATNNCSPSTSCTGGIYNPAPTVTPTLTSCGTSPTMGTGSTNASGQFVPGTGSPTSCTLTFAGGGFNIPGGTSGPVCVFIPSATGFSITRNASSASAYTIDSSAAMSGLIQYQCSAPQGQADQGSYPYPYFWR